MQTVSEYVHNYLGHDYSLRWLFTLTTFLIGKTLCTQPLCATMQA